MSLLPQFLDRGDPVVETTLFLSGLFLAMGLASLLAYSAIASRMAGFLRSDRVRRRVELVSGAVLVTLGLRVVRMRRRCAS